jgi:amino acid transporter
MSTLARRLGLVTLTLYGVGVIVGAGIYVLIGKIVGVAGNGAWLAFLGAALAALPTGLSYAELASRHPRSAGEAVFVERAFGRAGLAFLVGYLILASGVASTAAVSHGFASYCVSLLGWGPAARLPVTLLFLAALSWLNHRGIEESAWVNALCTVVSVAALLLLVAVGIDRWGSADLFAVAPPGEAPAAPRLPLAVWLSGAALAFYAFIGFEDICNVAEEVREPQRTIPRAILWSLAISTLVYGAVAITAVAAVPGAALAASDVPLLLVSRQLLPSWPPQWLAVVALFATTNTALFNLIMSSRILYGMGQHGWIPRAFARVHPTRRTPTLGVVSAFVLTAAFSMTGVLKVLAESTNVIILCAFFAVNVALVAIRWRGVAPDDAEVDHFHVPLAVPILGAIVALTMVMQFSWGAYLRAALLLATGILLYLVKRRLETRSG